MAITDWMTAVGTDIGIFVAIGAGAAAARPAFRAVREARQLREDQARPFVVITLEPCAASRHFLDIVVRNLGKTVARDVRFTFDKPLQSTVDKAGYPIANVKFLRDGITVFAPGADYRVLFDSLPDRHNANRQGAELPDSYTVTVRYKDRNGVELPADEYVLDSSLSRSAPYAQEFKLHDLVKEVASLRKSFEALAARTDFNG
jgi:hypothetical protein